MNHARAHTLALVEMLRHVGGVSSLPSRRRRRLTPQRQPELIRVEYLNAIVAQVCAPARAAVAAVEHEVFADLREVRRSMGKFDAAPRAAIDRAASRFAAQLRPTALHAVAAKFGQRTNRHQREQLDQQVREAIGVSYLDIEKPIRDHVEAWTRTNVDLIVTVPDRYFARLRGDVEQAYADGTHPETLAKTFADRYEISVNDARRIARDQVGKLNGQLNVARQKSLGITKGIWRTMNDERVRDSHTALEGAVFDLDDPPVDEATGEAVLPGEAIQCRCYAEPNFSELLGD